MGVKRALREFDNRSKFPESDVEQQQEIDLKEVGDMVGIWEMSEH